MTLVSIIKFSVMGLPQESGLEKYGIVFWTLSSLLSGLIIGSIPYLIYRLIAKKWNNNAYIIFIVIAWFIILIFRMN